MAIQGKVELLQRLLTFSINLVWCSLKPSLQSSTLLVPVTKKLPSILFYNICKCTE